MKPISKLVLAGLLAFSFNSLTTPVRAQSNITIVQPTWGPAVPAGTQYYYIPEVGGYYDLGAQRYVIQRDKKWTRVTTLNGYNPSNFHPVVLDYRGTQPWSQIQTHKAKYPKGGHPHGMPPGQAKKMRSTYGAAPGSVIVVNGKGNKGGKDKGKGKH